MDKILAYLKTAKKATFYEYYDGLHLNNELIIKDDGEHLSEFQNSIFKALENAENLEYFEYYSRFGGETSFECMKIIPKTLKVLKLANFYEVNVNMIALLAEMGVECHHQNEEYYEDDKIVYTDDSDSFQLIDNKWIPK